MFIRKNFIYLKGNKSLKEMHLESGISENTLEKYSNSNYKTLENISLPKLIELTQYFQISIDDFIYKDLSKSQKYNK